MRFRSIFVFGAGAFLYYWNYDAVFARFVATRELVLIMKTRRKQGSFSKEIKELKEWNFASLRDLSVNSAFKRERKPKECSADRRGVSVAFDVRSR